MDQVGQARPGRLGDPAPSGGAGAVPSGGAGPTNAADVDSFIEQTVHSKNAVIFSKQICPSSRKAKEIIGARMPASDVAVYELDAMPNGSAVQDALEKRTGKHTVPIVFLHGDFVGGADDVEALNASGRLQ